MLCPDGLHYNPEALWPAYPCSYPTEVTCVGRGAARKSFNSLDTKPKLGITCNSYLTFSSRVKEFGSYIFIATPILCDYDCPSCNPVQVFKAMPLILKLSSNHSFSMFPEPPIPTQDCPHQYGFYPSPAATEHECGMYRMCVAGQAIEMMCPPKLAFNAETARCDWPDLVPSCDARGKG